MRRFVLLLALYFGAAGVIALAQTDTESFDDPALEARYQDLIHTLRCLQCMNQSIAESPSDTAGDIRRQVRQRMADGESDGQIRNYLVSRYGDFISYRPLFKPSTWLLWSAPVLLLIVGGIVFVRIMRLRMQQPLDEELE